MNSRQRKMLAELYDICNSIGGRLDLTATSVIKLQDRQQAHGLVSTVILGVLSDVKENPDREQDIEIAKTALEKLRSLPQKEYKDKVQW